MSQARTIFGANVRTLRKLKGLSQKARAEACNLHRTYAGSVERGECNVSIDAMECIADALSAGLPEMLADEALR